MAKLNVIDLEGTPVGEIDVADEVFAAEVKEHLLWEAVRYQRAKRRSGTAKTKERNEINRTSAKMFKQKGTGNARHGNKRVNIFRGGGTVHGPRPRSYAFHVNKKACRRKRSRHQLPHQLHHNFYWQSQIFPIMKRIWIMPV